MSEILSRSNITEKFAEDFNLKKSQADEYVSAILGIIHDTIIDMDLNTVFKLGNIGVFSVKKTNGGKRRNPKTQEIIEVQPKNVVKFRPLPKFKAAIARIQK